MSPIGRIFIVLNLLLAAAFLGFASNALGTTEDWKEKYEAKVTEMEDEIAQRDEDYSSLNSKHDALKDEKNQESEQKRQAEAQVSNLQTQLDEAKRENASLSGDIKEIKATLANYDQTINDLSSAKDTAVAERHAMEGERDDALETARAAEQAKRNAEDSKREADAQIASLETERTSLQENVASLETRMQVLVNVTGVSYEEILTQPDIDARVLDARLDLAPGLVMINAGKNQEVKRGYTFQIWAGKQYKGQVRVENVQDNLCSAIVINAVPGTTISQGDRASTHI